MIISTFFASNKDGKKGFFEESFFLANIYLDVVLNMLLLTMNNSDLDFQVWDS